MLALSLILMIVKSQIIVIYQKISKGEDQFSKTKIIKKLIKFNATSKIRPLLLQIA
jgi:hypothetical protein